MEFSEFVKVLGLLTSTTPNDDSKTTHMRVLSEIKQSECRSYAIAVPLPSQYLSRLPCSVTM